MELFETYDNDIITQNFKTWFEEINDDILKQVDYIVNLPKDNWCTKPSTVLKLDEFGSFYKIR